jgi:predicted metal-dependent HD superfamily phosphohydrolase
MVWQGLNARLWRVPRVLAMQEFERLAEAYDAPGRAYHNSRHLLEVLDALRRIGSDDPAVLVAAFYHDAVYDPRRTTNEEDSVTFMREAHASMSVEPLPEVEPLVLATKTHLARTPGEAALLDADLAILASAPERYDEYAQAIREEYAHVPDGDFAAGRASILRKFLERDRIYRTPAYAPFESLARANLRREVASLENR